MEELDKILDTAKDFLSEENLTEIQSQLSKILKNQPNDALTIAFCGTFPSGKSSLINELLQSQSKLLVGASGNEICNTLEICKKAVGLLYVARRRIFSQPFGFK